MDELYRVANEYYIKLESIMGLQSYKSQWFWGVLATVFIFFTSSYSLIHGLVIKEISGLVNWWFVAALLSELLMFYTWSKFISWKKDKILTEIGKEFNLVFEDIKDAKVMLLKSYFSCDALDFSPIAEQLHRMLEKTSLYSNDKSIIEQVYDFIYNKSSEARILTLFVVLCSIITALSISSGQTLTSLFDAFSGATWSLVSSTFIQVLIIAIVISTGVASIFHASKDLMIFIRLNLLFKSDKSIHSVQYLIKDLNKYHVFEKTEEKKIILTSRKTSVF